MHNTHLQTHIYTHTAYKYAHQDINIQTNTHTLTNSLHRHESIERNRTQHELGFNFLRCSFLFYLRDIFSRKRATRNLKGHRLCLLRRIYMNYVFPNRSRQNCNEIVAALIPLSRLLTFASLLYYNLMRSFC